MMQRICFVWTNGENVDAIGGISNTMKVSFIPFFSGEGSVGGNAFVFRRTNKTKFKREFYMDRN